MAPADGEEMEEMLEFAVGLDGPVAIRYPKGSPPAPSLQPSDKKIQTGKAAVLKEGKDFVLIALGSMVAPGLEALEALEKEGLSGTLINARFVRPLDVGLFKSFIRPSGLVFTAEEGIIEGGFGSAVAEALNMTVHKIGLPCEFIPHGKREILLDKYGLGAAGIARKIREVVRKNG
jgi:1-deoxy-D-xylulose-5-phosphate synthase